MRRIFLLIFVSLNFTIHCQVIDSVLIKINVFDCKYCYFNLSFINNVQNCKVTILGRNNEGNECLDFSKKYFSNIHPFIILSDSIFSSVSASLFTEVYFFFKGNLFYKQILKKVSPNFKLGVQIDTISSVLQYSSISPFAKVLMLNGDFVISDPYKGKLKYYISKLSKFINRDFNNYPFYVLLSKTQMFDSSELGIIKQYLSLIYSKKTGLQHNQA